MLVVPAAAPLASADTPVLPSRLLILTVGGPPGLTQTGQGSAWQKAIAGLSYVRANRLILGAMSLDLFAVLLGGVTALLPIFAQDILRHVRAATAKLVFLVTDKGELLWCKDSAADKDLYRCHAVPCIALGKNLKMNVRDGMCPVAVGSDGTLIVAHKDGRILTTRV